MADSPPPPVANNEQRHASTSAGTEAASPAPTSPAHIHKDTEEDDRNSPVARARRRREAAEAGRRAALAEQERIAADEAAARKQAEAASARQKASELEARRQRAEKLAAQLESRMRAAPAVVPEPSRPTGPRPRVPSPAIAAAAAASAGGGTGRGAEEAARVLRMAHLRRKKDEERAERERLLAEARADRAHRQARFGQVVGLNAEEAGAGAAATAAAGAAAVRRRVRRRRWRVRRQREQGGRDEACRCGKRSTRSRGCDACEAGLVWHASHQAAIALQRLEREDAQTPASDLSSPIIELEPPPPISPPISSTTSPTTPHLPHPPGSAADGTRVRLVKLPQSSKPSERAEERASRLSVRLPHGEVIELPFSPLTTIDELLSYLACKQGAAMEVSTAEELVEAYALLDRSAFPPLSSTTAAHSEAGLSPGCTLVLQRRGARYG